MPAFLPDPGRYISTGFGDQAHVHINEPHTEFAGQDFPYGGLTRCAKSNKCYTELLHSKSDKQ
jgi:hypothetical protein